MRSGKCLPGGPSRLSLLILLFMGIILIAPASGVVIVEYFHQQGCAYCVKTDPLVTGLGERYGGRIVLDSIEIDDREGIRLLMSYGVTEVPVVVINRNLVLPGTAITAERLDEEILRAEAGAYPVPSVKRSILSRDPLPGFLFSFILGLMTGLSPCLIGSLILLVAAAAASHEVPGRSAGWYPVVYGTGIVIAYLIVAAAVLGAGVSLMPDAGSRLILYSAGGIIAILAGLVQIGLFTLPDRLSGYSSVLISRVHTPPGVFLTGIIFAVLFAPCAIAPFLILIETLFIDRGLAPAVMLFSFSLGILTPYCAFAVLRSSARERLLRYSGFVQKAGGILLIVFGIWLILSR